MSPRPVAVGVVVLLVLVGLSPSRPLVAEGATAASFSPAFRQPSGNEWWVQVFVDTDRTLKGVDVRIDGGDWRALALRSWGGWAESYRAPDGSLVQFRAVASDGVSALSHCYRWTAAAATQCPPEGEPVAPTFRHGGGNGWWVEAAIEPRPAAVEAMDEGGAWVALTFRDWGEWAGSFRIEQGHLVRFRAQISGTWVVSCWFTHPAGEVRECDGPPANVPPLANGSRRLLALGDTDVTPAARANAEGAARENVSGFVGLGDYWYDAPPQTWKDLWRPFLEQGAYLSLGNHDELPPIAEYLPNGSTWSAEIHGARVVAIDSTRLAAKGSEQYLFLREALCGASEPLRILIMHHPWWLEAGARHPGSEFPAAAADMEALVQECGVDLVLAGHEHNYQRLMRGDVAYVIVGTGGRSLYPLKGVPDGTVVSYAGYGRLLLDVNASGYVAHFRTLGDATLDTFHGSGNATYVVPELPPPPAVSFVHRGGNEWWVEARVTPAPMAVQAMDTGGEWRDLTLRSWGNWAGSFRIEPGHEVRFRAQLDGQWVESCWFSHPDGHARCDGAAPPSFAATFSRASGNTWWLQVFVEGTRPLAGVDASIDGGAWKPLARKDWGAWAASYHAPQGSSVVFRATSTDGATASSQAYAWPPS